MMRRQQRSTQGRSSEASDVYTGQGLEAYEAVLTFEDFKQADEVFMSGNMSKVTPITAFDEVQYQEGPVTRQVRDMYWDWAASVGT